MSITASGSAYLLNLFRSGDYPVDSYYLALIRSTPPGYTISGSELDEPPAAEYSRAKMTNQSANWKITGEAISNAFEIAFPLALTDWGKITYWALCDDRTKGRVFLVGRFFPPLISKKKTQVIVSPGSVSMSISGREWNFS